MKEIVIEEPYKVEVKEVPTCRPSPSQILTKTKISGISAGTEMHEYRGSVNTLSRPLKVHSYPIVPGYENVGEVIEVGKEVEGFEAGDRIISCGTHTEFLCLPNPSILPAYSKIPDSVTDEEAVFAVLGTVASHCIRRARIGYGDNVAVIGQGVVGILAAQHAKNVGAGKVITLDYVEDNLKISKQVGADVTINRNDQNWIDRVMEESEGLGADVVIEAVGSWLSPTGTVSDACRIVRDRGKVVILGWHLAPSELVFGDVSSLKEIEFINCRGMGPGSTGYYSSGFPEVTKLPTFVRWDVTRGFRHTIRLLEQGKLNVLPMVTHRFGYRQIREAYDLMDKRKENFLKAILQWQ